MKAKLFSDSLADDLSKVILAIGDSTAPSDTAGETSVSHVVTPVDTLDDPTAAIFPDLHTNCNNLIWLCERAILTPKSIFIAKINDDLLRNVPRHLHTKKSADTVVDSEEAVHYPTEVLKSLDLSGLPPNQLHLQIGDTVMLLRNLEPSRLYG
ncbi:unnamed protein product [Acanthosepion pharaonis]|uniref:DNA helicase Pif1-like 2B domain-containing protein n=1 Tax=Acanthosepion pharaonis TaxID=158019 RepID=A0A812EGS6_ACAPH|nr:unnamed protein product [Sepia pharaonis]